MTRTFPYHLLQIVPDRLRGEVMNLGIVLDTDAGPVIRLRVLPHRLRALSPELGRLDPEEYTRTLTEALDILPTPDMRRMWLREAMGPVRVAETQGKIFATDDDDLDAQVNAILDRMVASPRADRPARAASPRRSKLLTELTSWLRGQNLFSRNLPDIAKHRVVSGYPISVEEEVFAELALQNGVLHVIESLDLRGHDSYTRSLRNEASHKAMVLDLAGDMLDPNSQRVAVVASDNYEDMRPALRLLGRKSTMVVSMDSPSDRDWLAHFVASALHVDTLLPLPSESPSKTLEERIHPAMFQLAKQPLPMAIEEHPMLARPKLLRAAAKAKPPARN